MNTLFGKKEIAVKFADDDEAGTVTVTQFKLADYPALMREYDNEFALVARAVGRDVKFVQTLTPASYEEVLAAMREINAKGFFAYAGRQIERGNSAVAGWIGAGVPPEKIPAMTRGWSAPSPTLPPTPA
jgi:hypothetical protein